MKKACLPVILLCYAFVGFTQGNTQSPLLDYDYDRCEEFEFGGGSTISLSFKEEGRVVLQSDVYVIKPQFANETAYNAEIDRISASGGSIMEMLEARAQMYDNTEKITEGTYSENDGYLKIYLASNDILETDFLNCELGGRYLMCFDVNFVLAYDEGIIDYDVITIENVVHWELTFQEDPVDRWVVHINSDNLTLENGEAFQLESLSNRGQYLGHGRDGTLKLFPPEEAGISYDFRVFDSNGQGVIDALDDLKMKPAYFFGENSYVIGIDQETNNVAISSQFESEENLWYIESAMCDIVDELVGNR